MRFHFLLAALALIASTAPPALAAQSPASGPSVDPWRQSLVVQSRILGQERPVRIALPPSFTATQRTYPVIVILDGEADFDDAVTVSRRLAELGHIPEAIIVGIPNVGNSNAARVHDLTPPGLAVSGSSLHEGGDLFLDFIERELLPELQARFRAGRPRILVGHSSGGIIATYAAATRSSAFPVVVSIDAPIQLGDDWLAHRLLDRARASGGPVRYVSIESRFGWTDPLWAALRAAAPASWHIRRERLEGEAHETMVFLALYQGLKFAFADYSITGAPLVPRAPAMAAFDHYAALGREFGTDLPPPRPVLRQLVIDLLTVGQVAPARRAFDWLERGYGHDADNDAVAAMIANVAARPPLTESVAALRATPLPTADQIRPWLGEWRGEERLNADTVFEIGLRLRIVDSQVVAEILDRPDGTEHATRVDYLKIVPGGLEFGRVNGTRPMGMMVYEAQAHGAALEGRAHFRGIVIPLPEGPVPLTSHFRLRRTTAPPP